MKISLRISLFLNIVFLGIIVYLINSPHLVKKTTNNLDNNLLSILVENDEGKYIESEDDTWPQERYTLNKEKSGCENGSTIEYDNNDVIISAKSSDRCYVYFDLKTLSEYLIENYTLGVNGLYYHDLKLTGGAEDNSYRYSGPSASVNNFVCLDGGETTEGACASSDANLYRIIGLFKNGDDKYEAKLIKYDYSTATELGNSGAYFGTYAAGGSYKGPAENIPYIGGYYWTSPDNQVNQWHNSKLNNINLNESFIAYLQGKGIDTEKLITDHKWKTIGYSSIEVTPKTFYNYELGLLKETNPAYPTAQEEENQKIGLLYVSDYGYAVNPTTTANYTRALSQYAEISANNWLFYCLSEWTITRNPAVSYGVWFVGAQGGYLNTGNGPAGEGAIRPAFYCSTKIKRLSGDGSKNNPFRILVD